MGTGRVRRESPSNPFLLYFLILSPFYSSLPLVPPPHHHPLCPPLAPISSNLLWPPKPGSEEGSSLMRMIFFAFLTFSA